MALVSSYYKAKILLLWELARHFKATVFVALFVCGNLQIYLPIYIAIIQELLGFLKTKRHEIR